VKWELTKINLNECDIISFVSGHLATYCVDRIGVTGGLHVEKGAE